MARQTNRALRVSDVSLHHIQARLLVGSFFHRPGARNHIKHVSKRVGHLEVDAKRSGLPVF